jgi:hypothetical protein
MALQVTGDVAPRATAQTGQGLPVGEIAGPIENDVHWVRPDRPPLYRQPWAYVTLLVPIVIAAGGFAYRRSAWGGTGATDDDASEGLDDAQRHLQGAHRHLRAGETRTFYQTVERALARHLARHDVPAADREALHDLLDACEQAQFTPAEPSHEAMEAALDQAQTLLLRLDDALPPRSTLESA